MYLNSTNLRIGVLIAFSIFTLLSTVVSVSGATMAAGDMMNEASQQQENDKMESRISDLATQALVPDTNPHWDKNGCGVCHLYPSPKDRAGLRLSGGDGLCIKCHAEDVVHKYIHPTGVPMPGSMSKRIKKTWSSKIRLDNNDRLICLTCHDILNQCLNERRHMKQLNARFLRGGPYSKRTDICYKCHDQEKYQKLNSHEQIAEDGTLNIDKCRLCHTVKDARKVRPGIKRNGNSYPIIGNLDTDRTLLCVRCHKKIDHPSSSFKVASINKYRHLVQIRSEKKTRLEEMKEKTGLFIPVETATGRIYCGTCHEAHQPGVFAGESTGSMKGVKNRLRAKDICIFCHDK